MPPALQQSLGSESPKDIPINIITKNVTTADGTTVEAGVDCPECDWMLIVLEDPDAHAPVFECARCTYAQTVDGRPWNGTRLDRPSTDTLARWGYLRRKRGRR